MSKFKVGDRVRHCGGGIATINGVDGDRIKVKWNCDGNGERWPLASNFSLVERSDKPPWLLLEVGKFYRTREGSKARCLVLDSKAITGRPVIMEVESSAGWGICFVTVDGMLDKLRVESSRDIIGPWIDKPEMDFSVLPEWWKSVAMDINEEWWWSSKIMALNINRGVWESDRALYMGRIPPEHAPKWEGPWEESLVVRGVTLQRQNNTV